MSNQAAWRPPTWRRDNKRKYASRETCQRACDWLNNREVVLWREPVIALDGDHFEMWACLRIEAWEYDPDHDDLEDDDE